MFSRLFHRIAAERPVRFAMDLVPHEADWRGGLRFLVSHYPAYFNPSNPTADDMAGTSAYASSLASFDADKMRRMAFRTNWMASFDFPYMGLFIPPVGDDESWDRFSGDSGGEYTPAQRGRNGRTSIRQMADYSVRMREQGFYVLNYFNVTEFGEHIAWPPKPTSPDASAGDWRDASAFLRTHFDSAMMRQPDGKPYFTWGGAVAMDPGEPAYQAYLLQQVRLHIQKFPASSGLCIDRMDWLRLYNPAGDDGVSWFDDRPVRSLVVSWHDLIDKLAADLHGSGKVLFCNNHTKRVDLLRKHGWNFRRVHLYANVAQYDVTAWVAQANSRMDERRSESASRPRRLLSTPLASRRLSDGAVSGKRSLDRSRRMDRSAISRLRPDAGRVERQEMGSHSACGLS